MLKYNSLLDLLQNLLSKAQEEESHLLVVEPDPVQQEVLKNQAPQVRGRLIDPDQEEEEVGGDQSQLEERETATALALRTHHHQSPEVTEEEGRSLQGGKAVVAEVRKRRGERRSRKASLLGHPVQEVRAEREEIEEIQQELPPRKSREPIQRLSQRHSIRTVKKEQSSNRYPDKELQKTELQHPSHL